MEQRLSEYDVVILGSGPAGLQAAVHAARSKAHVAVLGRMQRSSLYKAHIENYCCLDATVPGSEVLEHGRRQAERFGAHLIDLDVVDLKQMKDDHFSIVLENSEILDAWSIILAMGISRNRLNVPGEKEFVGKGVSYCIDCDANFFRDQPVVVAGNQSAAFFGALSLLMIARTVHLVYGEPDVGEQLSYQVERSSIVKHPGCKIKSIFGSQGVEGIVLDNNEKIEAAGVFIELGAKGALELATKLDIGLDPETGYIRVSKKQETNIPGVYAAGDICGPPWQMAKAVGEGCVAGLEASLYTRQQRMKRS